MNVILGIHSYVMQKWLTFETPKPIPPISSWRIPVARIIVILSNPISIPLAIDRMAAILVQISIPYSYNVAQ